MTDKVISAPSTEPKQFLTLLEGLSPDGHRRIMVESARELTFK